MGGAWPARFVPDLKPIPDDVKPSATTGREIIEVLVESVTFVRQVANEQSSLAAVRWLPSSHGNAAFPEQQFRCIKRTAAPEACPCMLCAG
jgi:hypothetical protein